MWHFQRYNRAHPERGGAEKDPAFWHRGAIKAHRVLISDVINAHLEQAGQAARIHPDSLKRRELDRQPEPKLLPSESRAYREQGKVSARMQEVLDIRQERASQLAKEQVQARTYWEGRKAELGITRDVPMPAKLQAITQARTQTRDHAPERAPVGQRREQDQTREPRRTERERPRPVRQTARQWDRPRAPVQSGRELVRQMRKLAQAIEHDQAAAGSALRVRLREEEQEREHDCAQGWGF